MVGEPVVSMEQLHEYARALGELLQAGGLTIGVAESCTGGLLAAALTANAGASAYFQLGVVAYDNRIKTDLLKVPLAEIEEHGAVSAQVATAMAAYLVKNGGCSVGASTTGVAGPGGGSADKPVGTAFVGVCLQPAGAGAPLCESRRLSLLGSREEVRRQTVAATLQLLIEKMKIYIKLQTGVKNGQVDQVVQKS